MRRLACCLALLLPVLALAQSPDHAREKRWADEITPAILVGDAVDLELPSGRKFLGILATAPNAKGGVVLVHGLGVHPDWGLLNPLRSQLVDHGYTTLSVQMPVLAADAPRSQYAALFPDAVERIRVAVSLLRRKGVPKIAIVSHSLGSRMANAFFVEAGSAPVEAWVAIGITAPYAKPDAFRAPILDIYGEKDFPDVLSGARARADVIRRIRGSGQVEVAGADHYFNGHEAELVKQVRIFLDARLR
jgi:pimeloyl-ACP methyl ester carboxylesterase